jgi:pimeloyl-ACP methyl ester carboxylesterase
MDRKGPNCVSNDVNVPTDWSLPASSAGGWSRNGSSEFNNAGSLKTWSVIDKLDAINVPTLITNGDHDEAADSVLAPFVERIAGAKWVKFQVRRYR